MVKKFILGATMVAMALVAPSYANAQQKILGGKATIEKENAKSRNAENDDCCCQKECKKGDKKHGMKGEKRGDRKGDKKHGMHAKQQRNIFAGLNLTDQQKEQIKALQATREDFVKKYKDAAKKSIEKGDTIFKKQRLQKEWRKNYLESLKKIMTPEQYNALLENYFIQNPQVPVKPHKNHHHK